MAGIIAQAQDCHHPETAPTGRSSRPIIGTLIERQQIEVDTVAASERAAKVA
jgi:hypothetical protein